MIGEDNNHLQIAEQNFSIYLNQPYYLHATLLQIQKDFALVGVDLPVYGEVVDFDALCAMLVSCLRDLHEKNSSQLNVLLYHVDIPEKYFEKIQTSSEFLSSLARGIVYRECLKVITREWYGKNNKS